MTLSAADAEKLLEDLDRQAAGHLRENDRPLTCSTLCRWVADLPEELKFEGAEKSSSSQGQPQLQVLRGDITKSNFHEGFLHLLYIPVRFLVTRPFMRISFQLPERFSNISVGPAQWNRVEHAAREAIKWVDKNESCLEGWFVGTYSFFVCSLIQVRRAPYILRHCSS